jgi:hypothetical protein
MSKILREQIQGSVSSCCNFDKTWCVALFQYLYGSSSSDWLWLLVSYTGPFSRTDRPASCEYHHNGYNGTGAHTKTENLFHYTNTMTRSAEMLKYTEEQLILSVVSYVVSVIY